MSVPEPSKILTPWATSGLKNAIPPTANPATGNAGYDQGFPAINMVAKEAGGIPPFGQDFNGIFYDVTNILRYMQAGGRPTFSAELSAAIGGYPKSALVLGDDGITAYRNTIASNTSNPNAGGAGWVNEDTAPTPPQFDNDTSLATTAFVQRALGNMQGGVVLGASQVLSAADVGKVFSLSVSASPITLPLYSTVPSGAKISFVNVGSTNVVIQRSGTDTLFGPGDVGTQSFSSALTSYTLLPGDCVEFTAVLQWQITGGTCLLQAASSFVASKAGSGYQKLPSGLIIQWATGATDPANPAESSQVLILPIAFPNASLISLVSTEIATGSVYADCLYQTIAPTSPLTQVAVMRQFLAGSSNNVTTKPRVLAIGF